MFHRGKVGVGDVSPVMSLVYNRKKISFEPGLHKDEEIKLMKNNLEHANPVLHNFPSIPLADLFMKMFLSPHGNLP